MTGPLGDRPAEPISAVQQVPLRTSDDIVLARRRVREAALAADLDLVAQTKVITATSELARNTLIHGLGGDMTLCCVRRLEPDGRDNTGVVVEFFDEGPGISDLDLAMTGGWSSGTGLGLGLPGSRRLVHEFDIDSQPGRGTRIRIVVWRRPG